MRYSECFSVYRPFSQGGGSDAERTKKKKRGDRYSVQTSLIVAALKKMLPIGLNMCSPADQELINLAKIRYSLVLLEEVTIPYDFYLVRGQILIELIYFIEGH